MAASVLHHRVTDHLLTPPSTADGEDDYFLTALSNVLSEEHIGARLFRCNALGMVSRDLADVQSNDLAMALIQAGDLDAELPHDELVERANEDWNYEPGSQLFDGLPAPEEDASMLPLDQPFVASMSAIAEETERDFASTVTADTMAPLAVSGVLADPPVATEPPQSSEAVIAELVDDVVHTTIAAGKGEEEEEAVEVPAAATTEPAEEEQEVVKEEEEEEKPLWWAKSEEEEAAPAPAEEEEETAMEEPVAAPAEEEAEAAPEAVEQEEEEKEEEAEAAAAPAPAAVEEGQEEAAAPMEAEEEAGPAAEEEAGPAAAAEDALPALEALLEAAGGGPYPFIRDVSLLDVDYDRSASTKLGEGANGTVSTLTRRETGEACALKTMAPPHAQEDASAAGDDGLVVGLRVLLDDVSMQKRLGDGHPHIAKVHDVFVDTSTKELLFVMPLASGGAVPEYLAARSSDNPLDERGLASLVATMLSTVAYCHEQHVVHRDIKLENFVFTSADPDAELMLIDFGMATHASPEEELEEGCTTLYYQAPEMQYLWHAHVVKTGGEVKYGAKVDVWAMGLIAYQLLYGVMPFGIGEAPEEEEEETIDRIVYEPLALPEAPSPGAGSLAEVSAAARAFCERLLQRHPDDRPTAAEALTDPWLLGEGLQEEPVAAKDDLGEEGEAAKDEEAEAPAAQEEE